MTRARLIGTVIILAAFGAGVVVGRYLPRASAEGGVTIQVRATDEIPRELNDLSLTDSQQVLVHQALRNGTMRVRRVVQSFMAPMDAAIDSTDREVRGILTVEQNRKLDEIRRAHPLKQMREQRVIDTVRRP